MQASGKYRLSRIESRKRPCKLCNGKLSMATAIWRGSITFGLASIPIRLYAAARPKRIALHQLHNKCHTRLKQPLFCPTCNRFVERSEVVKGYEYEKGQYVLVEPEEIRSEEHTSELQSHLNLVCRLMLENNNEHHLD